MPIYEYYSPDTNKIYSFYAKTLAQGRQVPRCPDDPKARMRKVVSAFAVTGRHKTEPKDGAAPAADGIDETKVDAAMDAMEREFANVDENDPRALARMMRRMSEMTGEKFDEPMEEAVRKLEEGADPESLEDGMGGESGAEAAADPFGDPFPGAGGPATEKREPRARTKVRRPAPVRDPNLYDYD